MAELTDLAKQMLEKDIPVIRADIKAMYQKLDKRFGLHGAEIPITFGFDEDLLGSYDQGTMAKKEHFHFSLLFVGYAVAHPLERADREDLYLHEYAHYMQYNMEIPKKYQFQSGIHGSAWKYCCSLIGAAPTPYYKAGEALMPHDYQKALKKRDIKDKTVPLKDIYRRQQADKKKQGSSVKFAAGDVITHPKYGEGTIEEILAKDASVTLIVRFGEERKKIDQAWLLKSRSKK